MESDRGASSYFWNIPLDWHRLYGRSERAVAENSLDSGLIDRAGFEKGSFWMMKSLWCDEPMVHLTTQTLEKSPYIFNEETGFIGEENAEAWKTKVWIWHNVNTHWNYADGEMIAVEVYSNCEKVELFLNGESLGAKNLADFEDHIYKWAVPYAAGKLEARAVDASAELTTAGSAAAVKLSVDGCHVIAQIVDENGVAVKTDEREIRFEVSGEGKTLGVDNGSPYSVQDYQSDRVTTAQGRCLVVLEGAANVTAICDGLTGATVFVECF